MIFRLSQKLSKKLKVAPKVVVPLDDNPFADWSAHLFTAQRAQYIILTNTPSLYSMVMIGKGITDDSKFIDAALTCMRKFMVEDGTEVIFRKFVAPASGEVIFSKPLDRSVTGSMNRLVVHAKFQLTERQVSLYEAGSSINDIPVKPLGYKTPREAFKGLEVKRESPDGSSETEA